MVFSSLYDLDAGAPKRAKIQRPDYASINAEIRGHAVRYQRGRNDIGPIVDDGRYVRVRYVFLSRNRRNRPFYVTKRAKIQRLYYEYLGSEPRVPPCHRQCLRSDIGPMGSGRYY